MEKVKDTDRLVANIKTSPFEPFVTPDGQTDGEVLQVNGGKPGYGFHIYRMQPGQWTVPHRHLGDEEFLLIEGDLKDHDGNVYKVGDLVCLRSGTIHSSYSEYGCVLAVFLRGDENV